MVFWSHCNFFSALPCTNFGQVLSGLNAAKDGGADGDTLLKMLDVLDLSGIRQGVSGLVRAVGFGPEADNIATVLLAIFFFLVVIGYAAGPKNDTALDKPKGDDKKDTDKKQ